MVSDGSVGAKRLDGWKSIAGYFNRDRTTVMRWARDRGLPVRRIPGGKQGSVFALEGELAAWAIGQDDVVVPGDRRATDDGAPAPPGAVAAPGDPAIRRAPSRRALAIAGIALSLLVVTAAWWMWPAPQRATSPVVARPVTMPNDAAAARDYVAARDAWAHRTPTDLRRAVSLYERVIARAPGFAPAHAGLAEAWLILREYGDVGEAMAYRQARAHTERALALDPRLPAAHRALGFIDYWWDNRTDSALARFRQALALDDRDPQTHFWYANVLADTGHDALAQREYDVARLLSPGSRVIEVEQACSHWQAGRDRLALDQLTALAKRVPDDATIYNCLAWVHISNGDIAAFARNFAIRARLRGEPQLLTLSRDLDAAVRRDPHTAVRVLIADGRREIATGSRRLRETPAFYASAMRDRPALMQLLVEANDVGERWYSAAVTRRIAAHWRGDAEVQRLLARLVPEPPRGA